MDHSSGTQLRVVSRVKTNQKKSLKVIEWLVINKLLKKYKVPYFPQKQIHVCFLHLKLEFASPILASNNWKIATKILILHDKSYSVCIQFLSNVMPQALAKSCVPVYASWFLESSRLLTRCPQLWFKRKYKFVHYHRFSFSQMKVYFFVHQLL